MKILVTAGGTRERIDGVRFITNFSTGKTGARLTEYLMSQGHQVIHFHGMGSILPQSFTHLVEYSDFEDLNDKLKKVLAQGGFELVIHAAAVSDFSVSEIQVGSARLTPKDAAKIDSSEADEISLKLKKNFKIIEKLVEYAPPARPVIVGFKLTNTDSLEARKKAVLKLSHTPGVDLVVHNDLSEIARTGTHHFRIYQRERIVAECSSAFELAQTLHRLVGRRNLI